MARRGTLIAIAVLGLIMGARTAGAASGSISLTDGSGLQFGVNDDITSATESSASGAARDAAYTAAVNASTESGGTTAVTLGDAFDGYSGLRVNGTYYRNNGTAGTECPGATSGVNRQAVFNPQTIGNLRVERKVYVPEDDAFIRFLSIVTNTGNANENVIVAIKSNVGSDAATRIFRTSDGDTTVDPTDTWAVTFSAFVAHKSTDVRIGHVFQGTGASVTVASNELATGVDRFIVTYATFVLAPGQTGSIMNLATGQPSRAAAAQKATNLATLPLNVLQCLTTDEQVSIRNFDHYPAISTTGGPIGPVNVGDSVEFVASGTDPDGQTLTLSWDFGDGTTGTGSPVTHAYTTAGRYTPSVRVSDFILTSPPFELSSLDVLDPLTLTNLRINLNFKQAKADRILINGNLPIPAGFDPTGKIFTITVGGVQQAVTLNKAGKGAELGAQVQLLKKKGIFKATLKGAFAATLAVDDLTGDVTIAKPGEPRKLVALIGLDGVTRMRRATLAYTAKAGKTGVATGK